VEAQIPELLGMILKLRASFADKSTRRRLNAMKSILLRKIMAAKAAGKTLDFDAPKAADLCQMPVCDGRKETKNGFCMECDLVFMEGARKLLDSL